jgi:hypothetical protein
MLAVIVKECKDCDSIKEILAELDEKIYRMTRDEYHSLAYLSNKNHRRAQIKRLIRYKGILENLFWNSSYYNYDFKTIVSKIKTLI